MQQRFKGSVAVALVSVLFLQSTVAAVSPRGAAYYGGTIAIFGNPKQPVEGTLNTLRDDALVFTADKGVNLLSFSSPYASIIDLEHGQKAGRRVGATVGYTVLLGPLGLLTLFSKKRNHFLTVGFHGDDGKDQVAVIELGKDIVRSTLPVMEVRSGKKIVYQDEEARKSAK